MDIKKYFEEQKIEPVQDRKDGMDYWTNYELFTYNDLIECMEDLVKKMSVTRCCKSDSEQLNVYFNVGDKVLFDNKKAVVLWPSVKYLDIEILGTNEILQGVHTSKVLPR